MFFGLKKNRETRLYNFQVNNINKINQIIVFLFYLDTQSPYKSLLIPSRKELPWGACRKLQNPSSSKRPVNMSQTTKSKTLDHATNVIVSLS